MNAVVKSFDNASTSKDYKELLLQLESITKNYPKEWLTYYYLSIIKSRMSMEKMGNSEELANQSIQYIEAAKKIQVNDELLCAESFAYTAKMSVSPYARWLRYEQKIKKPLQLAKRINKENPRIYALEAMLQYNMPVLLGGGCSNAISIAQMAADKLSIQAKANQAFIMPHWGANIIQEILEKCK